MTKATFRAVGRQGLTLAAYRTAFASMSPDQKRASLAGALGVTVDHVSLEQADRCGPATCHALGIPLAELANASAYAPSPKRQTTTEAARLNVVNGATEADRGLLSRLIGGQVH